MNQPHATLSSALPATENAAVPKARKPRQHLSAEQYITAADMLAAGHIRQDVATHFNIANSSFYRHVPPAAVTEAKTRRAQRIADGLEVLPEVARERTYTTRADKPALEMAVKVTRPRGEAQMKMSAAQRTEAADMLAAGHKRKAVAAHFAVTPPTTYKHVTVADVIAAKARRAQRIADGLEVMPQFGPERKPKAVRAEKVKAPNQKQIAHQAKSARADEDRANRVAERERKYTEGADMIAASYSFAAVQQHIGVSSVTLRKWITDTRIAEAKVRRTENIAAGRDVLPTYVRTRKSSKPVTHEEPTDTHPANLVLNGTQLNIPSLRVHKVTAAYENLPIATADEISAPAAQPLPFNRTVQSGTIARPNVPEGADLLLVPLTAASNAAMFRQQHQPPFGWTPSELWNGFIAINTNLREAHKMADVTDPLIDKMMRRFTIQRHTPATIAEQGDDFIREHRAEKFPGLMREVFLLVSHKKHQVLGEVWQDHKAGSATPHTVFVLDPKLAEQPKLDNLMVLLPEPTGKGQKYRSFTPTRTSRSPD